MKFAFSAITLLALSAALSSCSERKPQQRESLAACSSAFVDAYNDVRDKARVVKETLRSGTKEEAANSVREMRRACHAFYVNHEGLVCRASRSGEPTNVRSEDFKIACRSAEDYLPLFEKPPGPTSEPTPSSSPRPSDALLFNSLDVSRILFKVANATAFKKMAQEKLTAVAGVIGTPQEFDSRIKSGEVFCEITKTSPDETKDIITGSMLITTANTEQQRASLRAVSFATDHPYALSCSRQNSELPFKVGEARTALAGIVEITILQ